jgi:GNAT superfamily N-acetyltransferase
MAAEPPQARVALERVTIGPFDKTIRREPFTCGRVPIDNFLKHSAEDQHRKSYSRVYYALYEGRLAGYYSLAAASRDPRHISQDAVKRFAAILSAPCVYLGMLAVHQELHGCGIGKMLMVHAMERTLQVAEIVGIYALILQAADKEVGRRYKKWGFDYFLGDENADEPNMFIPLGTIRKAVKK